MKSFFSRHVNAKKKVMYTIKYIDVSLCCQDTKQIKLADLPCIIVWPYAPKTMDFLCIKLMNWKFGFLKDYKSNITRDPVSSSSNISASSGTLNTNETLSYEMLQSLDDIELANVVIFGNRIFRPLQHQACSEYLKNRDCFVLMPTGGGKSLCYQVRFLCPYLHFPVIKECCHPFFVICYYAFFMYSPLASKSVISFDAAPSYHATWCDHCYFSLTFSYPRSDNYTEPQVWHPGNVFEFSTICLTSCSCASRVEASG